MSRVYRTEKRVQDTFGSTKGLPGFIVDVEIPDAIVSALKDNSIALEGKAREVAKCRYPSARGRS
jgi:hypothetical protein